MEIKIGTFEVGMLRIILGPKMNETIGSQGKLHKEELVLCAKHN
jgi:hypothetical protein